MDKFKISSRRYLGSKTRLLTLIEEIVTSYCDDASSFFDVFGGTGVVGYHFNKKYSIIENDILHCNYLSFLAFLGEEDIDEEKLSRIIGELNKSNSGEDNYYSENFADTYLSKANMQKVGYIRDKIDTMFTNDEINARERAILVTSLIYAIDHIANTVGHYDAYRKGGELNRILELKMLDMDSRKNKNNRIYNLDSNLLATKIKADIAYIDPPYNSRQYADAYHFLENVAQNKKPAVEGVARKMDRTNLKSRYNMKSAPKAFDELIDSLDVKYILVSYNNMGEKGNSRSNAKISDEDIISSLKKRGGVKVFEQDFNTFTTGKTKLDDHKERVFFCKVGDFDVADDFKYSIEKIQSPLNYTGGKYKLLPQLEEKFPDDIDNFYDVFCGGCNVGANIVANKVTCVDKDKNVIALLKYLKNNSFECVNTQLIEKINHYGLSNTSENGYEYYGCNSGNGVGKYNSTQYLKLRDDFNNSTEKDPILFLLLIMFSFNNQIRFNSNGDFNLPVGKRDYNNSLKKKLKYFIANLNHNNMEFVSGDFEDLNLDIIAREGGFLYLDPPYSLGNASYNENNLWNEKEDERLFAFLDKCNAKYIRFALSNVMTHKGIRNEKLLKWCLDKQYNINYLRYNYNNASYHLKNKQSYTEEVLITNY
ncbi:MAG: Dam family site-specific DNA-(adenine-N6)-methyltransferase [Clostridiales bacterium]|nr:Dam family site-specific DNA-(adenine-N6)-methyltransferase [Candidatus Crickella equi]